eukprot:Gb_15568 [translate_table: standard]
MMEREWDEDDQPKITTWNQFVTAFYHNFEAYTQEDYFLALKNMEQQSTVTYYSKEFCQASLLVENILPWRVVSMYIDGLKDSLWGCVKALKPDTLEEAIQQAESYSKVTKSHFTIGTSSKTPQTSKGIINSNVFPTSTVGQFKSRMVDLAIIVDLRSKGLCFNCKGKWPKGHKCKTPGKIPMIEILNEEHPEMVESDQEKLVGAEEEIANIEDQEQQETPTVFLVAMLGITQYQTLRVRSKVKGRTIVLLVDSGNTHNFIDSKLVSSTELKVEPLQNFQLAVANDTMMDCKGMVRGLKLQLDSYELSSNFYVVALPGVDVVMWAQWLKTLGEIRMNLGELYMKFEKGQQLIIVKGLKPATNRLISTHKVTKQHAKEANKAKGSAVVD